MDLEEELRHTLKAINRQTAAIEEELKTWAVKPFDEWTIYELVDGNGRPIMTDLLVAKANVLNALATLRKGK